MTIGLAFFIFFFDIFSLTLLNNGKDLAITQCVYVMVAIRVAYVHIYLTVLCQIAVLSEFIFVISKVNIQRNVYVE